MHKLFLCWRYLCKRRMAFFGIAAVTLCVALLIVITSLFSGFIEAFLASSERLWGQIVLAPRGEMSDQEALAAELEKLEGVAQATPVTQTGALLYVGSGDVRGVDVVGIDLAKRCEDESFRRGLLRAGAGEKAVSFALSEEAKERSRRWMEAKLGRAVAEEQLPGGAIVGIGILGKPNELTDEYDRAAILKGLQERQEPLVITTSKGKAGQEDAGAARRVVWPVDAVQTGIYLADSSFVYLPFADVRRLIGTRGEDGRVRCASVIQITAQKGAAPEAVMARARGTWERFAAETLGWPAERIRGAEVYATTESPEVRMFTHEIRKQMAILQLMIGLICLVAALLVFVILFMIVTQKRRDIGIVRSLGSSRAGAAGIFLWYGGAIGGAGAVLGLILGAAATRHINGIEAALTRVLGFKVWKSGVYMFSEIPNEVAWSAVGWIMAAGVGAAMLGALLPALRAGRLEPVESLRYE